MTTDATTLTYDDLTRDPQEVIATLRAAIEAGQPWLTALLAAVQRWRVPHEVVEGRHFYYLIGGEAFDWLLLAERLLDAVADLVPEEERLALLFEGRASAPLDAETLKRSFGPAKHRAHLNFVYGVLVEQALQLAVEEEIHKEIRCRAWGFDPRLDESLYQRIYLKGRDELLRAFREQRSLPHGRQITFSELKEFTYWLFKYRVNQCDPAKVAADTRRGLTQLARLDSIRNRAASLPEQDAPIEAIEAYAW
jgi:hypothetical protein